MYGQPAPVRYSFPFSHIYCMGAVRRSISFSRSGGSYQRQGKMLGRAVLGLEEAQQEI